jgi:hypothetical protein
MRDVDVDGKIFYSPVRVDHAFSRMPQVYRDNIEDHLFDRAREMYEAAIYLTGCWVLDTSNQYQMRSYEGETPDVLAIKRAGKGVRGNLLHKTKIEVVTMRDEDIRSDVMQFLRETKLSPRKSYTEDDTILLSMMKVLKVDFTKLVSEIAEHKPAPHVFAIGKLKEQPLGDFFIARLHPNHTRPVYFTFQRVLDVLPTEGKIILKFGLHEEVVKTQESSDIDDPFEVLGLLDEKEEIIKKYGDL